MRNDRGYTYLITNGTHYKIGITTGTPVKRIAELQTGSPTKISISGYCYNSNALAMEIELHRKFASKRLEGEWFALNDDDVAMIHHHFEANYLDEYFAPLSAKGIEAAKREEAHIEKLRKAYVKAHLELSSYFNKHNPYNYSDEELEKYAYSKDEDYFIEVASLFYSIEEIEEEIKEIYERIEGLKEEFKEFKEEKEQREREAKAREIREAEEREEKERRLYFNKIEYQAKQLARYTTSHFYQWKSFIDEATMMVISGHYQQKKDETIIGMYDDQEEGKRIITMYRREQERKEYKEQEKEFKKSEEKWRKEYVEQQRKEHEEQKYLAKVKERKEWAEREAREKQRKKIADSAAHTEQERKKLEEQKEAKEKRLYFNRIEYHAKQINRPIIGSSPVAHKWERYIDKATIMVISEYYKQEKDETIIGMYDDQKEGKRIITMYRGEPEVRIRKIQEDEMYLKYSNGTYVKDNSGNKVLNKKGIEASNKLQIKIANVLMAIGAIGLVIAYIISSWLLGILSLIVLIVGIVGLSPEEQRKRQLEQAIKTPKRKRNDNTQIRKSNGRFG